MADFRHTESEDFALYCESREFSSDRRKKYAQQGVAMPDGSYPIPDKDALRRAIQSVGRAPANKRDKVKRHIVKRAKALGATNMLPDDWNVSSESDLAGVLYLEFDPNEAIQAQQDDGSMRVRVPFYRGNSVARPSGWSEPLFFSSDELPGILADGKQQLASGRQPLTVFGRHRHSVTADKLPVGKIVDLESVGSDGFAVLEIAPTSEGKDIQTLLSIGHLNAVSLRSQPGFDLEEKKVNGEPMYSPTGLKLAGIDFAPEGPAMDTFGVQILSEANVEPLTADDTPSHEEEPTHMELTLEDVRKRADIVAELEKPLRDELTANANKLSEAASTIEARDKRIAELEASLQTVEVEKAIDTVAARFPDSAKAREVLAELCKDAKSEAEVFVKAMPALLEALQAAQNQGNNRNRNQNQNGGNSNSNSNSSNDDDEDDEDDDQNGNGNNSNRNRNRNKQGNQANNEKSPAQLLAELVPVGGAGQPQSAPVMLDESVEYAGNLPLPPA